MAKSWNRLETWLTLILAGVGVVILGVGGLWIYMSTTPPIFPDAKAVPSVAGANAADNWMAAIEQARQISRTGVADHNLPGMSVAVGVDGELLWAEGFGFASLESRAPVSPRTRFRIGNASVLLTSAAAGLLIEQQQLKLDDEIQTYVPDFPKQKRPVTLRQVMGHVAGIPSDGGDEGPLFGGNCERPADALKFIGDRDLRFEPGTEYRFSNFGYILVSAAIEKAADESFLMFMQKNVFRPLHMDDTMAESAQQVENRAVQYFPRFASDPRYGPDPMRDINLSCYSGASVFLSTPSDLVRFAMAINGGKFLQPATVQLLQAEQKTSSGQGTGYGLGWDLETITLSGTQQQAVGHDGELLGGIAGSLMTFRDRGMVVSVLSNTSYADTPAIALKIAQAFADQRPRRDLALPLRAIPRPAGI